MSETWRPVPSRPACVPDDRRSRGILDLVAWEWVSPVVTGVVALAGIGSTVWTTTHGRDHAERLALQAHDRADAAATETRRQERLAAKAYLEVLDLAESIGFWAQRVRPIIDTNPPQPEPEFPSVETQRRAQTSVSAFGSGSVVVALARWREQVDAVRRIDRIIARAEATGYRGKPDHLDHWQHLNDVVRPAEKATRAELAEQIARELGAR